MDSNNRQTLGKNSFIAFMAIIIAVGLVSAVIVLSNSWIKVVVIVLIIASSIFWLVSHGMLRRVAKYTLFAVMIFAISFSAVEGYLFWNVGYPPTFENSQPNTTLSYPDILNTSLTEVVQSAKNTLTFRLFMFEHLGETNIEAITVDTTLSRGGRIEVRFYNAASKMDISFRATAGATYHATVTSLMGIPFSQRYPQQQTPEDTLQQIDNLGLQWYYDRAVEIYQNKTGTTPEINALNISIHWGSHGTYQGMILQMVSGYTNNSKGHGTFFAEFQPDGTLNDFNILD
jgi:hypothetical protein